MNMEQFLHRVFALARRSPDPDVSGLPFGLETTVLAHWRDAVRQGPVNGGLLRGLRWGALLACVIALLVSALASDELIAFKDRFDPEARVADSAVASYDYD
ncbi:MAG TPA: hypothetical protein VGL24_08270 [Chthoniobacterales bacterium]|jgi:hypothetical protein